ncbi:MAG: RNA polymerase sigma factor [Fibrobacteres bacterium]|nr:RNA polymerase sigma factor [Fibrobacterota bacterium]
MNKEKHERALGLYHVYKDKLYTVARRYLLDDDSAKDAVQELFVKIFENPKRIPLEPETAPYLYKMAVNMCIDQQRKRKRITTLKDLFFSKSKIEEQIQNRDEVDNLMKLLNDDMRFAVILSDMLELPVSEICFITGEQEGAVRTRLSRARAIMRESVKKEEVCYAGNC